MNISKKILLNVLIFHMSIQILRLASTFRPASISIEYRVGKSTPKYKQFPVVFDSFSDPKTVFQILINDYPNYFNENTIELKKLQKFVQQIIRKSPSIGSSFSNKQSNKTKQYSNGDIDNIVLSDEFSSENDL